MLSHCFDACFVSAFSIALSNFDRAIIVNEALNSLIICSQVHKFNLPFATFSKHNRLCYRTKN